MDESTTECDNTVVAADVIKDELVNGVDAASHPVETETIHDGNDVVCDERKEDIATDIKDVVQSGTYFLQEGEGEELLQLGMQVWHAFYSVDRLDILCM